MAQHLNTRGGGGGKVCLLCADTGAASPVTCGCFLFAETAALQTRAELKVKNRSQQASIDLIPIPTWYRYYRYLDLLLDPLWNVSRTTTHRAALHFLPNSSKIRIGWQMGFLNWIGRFEGFISSETFLLRWWLSNYITYFI